MKTGKLGIMVWGCACIMCSGVNAQAYFTGTTGVMTYNYPHLPNDPIRVFYHIPVGGDKRTMPILFAMHGVNRNASDFRDTWVQHANEKKIIVIAPEFANAGSFSGGRGYSQGGMYRTSNLSTLKPREQWTFSVIEALFDFIRQDLGNTQAAYDMWGHSAGGQFTHRYALFMPDARINRAVAANAGWYAVPDMTVNYPYGLKGCVTVTADSLIKSFAKKLYIQLGTADNDPNADELSHNAGAEAQGPHRYARGIYFWNAAQRESANMRTPLNWEKVEVEGVAHSRSGMARNAYNIFRY